MNPRVFRALHEIAVAIGGVLEPVELARLVVDRARELLNVDAAGVYVIDDATQLLEPLHSSDAGDELPEAIIPVGIGAAGQAVQRGTCVRVDDYCTWPHAGAWAVANRVRWALAVPLQVTDRPTGAMSVRTYTSRHWTDEDEQTLTLLAAQIAPALEAARLHERTRSARQQAEAAINLRDEVLAGVSHDLARPLARIRLYAELIQAESPNMQPLGSAQQLNTWSERIVASTIAMKTIMQDLVDVARLRMGQALQLDARRTDLVDLAQRLVAEHQRAEGPITFAADCDELVGWWDEPRLSRVVGNLLDNALKYSRVGTGVEVLVHDTHDASGDDIALLEVRDHGRGIPPEDLPRVFEQFYRGSNAGSETSGSGLGLAVARQIVEQHGGTLRIESQPEVGTVVSVRLPRSGLVESASR